MYLSDKDANIKDMTESNGMNTDIEEFVALEGIHKFSSVFNHHIDTYRSKCYNKR